VKHPLNLLILSALWVASLVLFGALARIAWFFLQVGWDLLP
jgi:hypothetical protein